MPRLRTRGAATVRTTLDMPVALWKAIKSRSIEEQRDLRDVLLDAVALYLRTASAPEDTRR